jgi:hypothetical protein
MFVAPRQVVWKDVVHVGCGRGLCDSGAVVVCAYDPPGNTNGQFNSQVASAHIFGTSLYVHT